MPPSERGAELAERGAELDLSIVVPVLDEAQSLPILGRELAAVLDGLGRSAEIIFVDDGSTDGSAEAIGELIQADRRVRLLRFKTHAGLTAAFDAGFKAARGRIVVTLDADLQNDPRDIGPMLARLEGGADAVVGWRRARADRWSRRLSSRVANAIRNWVTGDAVNDSACSLRVVRRECLAVLPPFRGMHRFVPTLLRMSGYRVVEMVVAHRPRRFGRSKFGIGNRARVAFEDLLAVRWMQARRREYSVVEDTEATVGAGRAEADREGSAPMTAGLAREQAAGGDQGLADRRPVRPRGTARRFVVLGVFALALFGYDLGRGVLDTNDGARFPVMARDILARGHWLFPEAGGAPMLNKPPLHAWLIALASLPAGAVTPRTAALPSIIGGIGIVLATAWLGARLFGAGVGATAGFMAATTAGLFSLARSPLPDVTLTLAITAAMCAFAVAELDGRRHALVAFYGFTGLAFLTKGAAGLIPLAVALAYLVLVHGPRGVRRLLSAPGLALLAALIAPWPLLALAVGRGQFVDHVLLKDMHANYLGLGPWRWQRMTGPVGQAVALLLPWSVLVPLGLRAAVREPDQQRARAARLVLAWAAVAFLLIAVSERQRSRYYLALCPPVALLAAVWYRRLELGPRGRAVAAAAALLVVAGLAATRDYEVRRADSSTDLGAMARKMTRAEAPVFAVDSPELVFDFYLDRPVMPLAVYGEFERIPSPALLIASDRVVSEAPPSLARLGIARVNGRPFVLLGK